MDFAREIKARLPATQVLPYYGIQINRAGFCCCPFHNEKTGSMKVYPEDGGYYCFGCHASGTVIDFVMQYFGLPFGEAIKKLNDDFSLGLPIGVKVSKVQRMEEARKAYIARVNRELAREEQRKRARKVEAAFDVWHALDAEVIAHGKIERPEDITPELAKALKEIDAASYNLDCAEIERLNHERAYKNSRI